MVFVRRVFLLLVVGFVFQTSLFAANAPSLRVKTTILEASNQGNDFNFDNDAYRDQLVRLFSYTSYQQLDSKLLTLPRSERSRLELKDGYELVLTYHGADSNRSQVHALIRKGATAYVDTVLSIENPGVVFVGGPPSGTGVLVIVLETGF